MIASVFLRRSVASWARRSFRTRLAWLVPFLFVGLFPVVALAQEQERGAVRLALVVGNNVSATLGRAELRFADDDAAKYAVLLGIGRGDHHVELLTRMDADTTRAHAALANEANAPTRAAVDKAAGRLAERARRALGEGRDVVFTFVFAGHGDVEGGRGFLELEDGRFFREDLESLLLAVPATRAHVILDACNSFYMLAARKPGGTRFATPEDIERSLRARLAHVGTFLSTSAEAEVYEWSQIESGVFSHAVRSGLSGAADVDGDGRITYGELRAFVRIAVAGVENTRFRPRLFARGPGGRDDEVIFETRTEPGRRLPLVAGEERRVTLLDAEDTPLVDVRVERGFAPAIALPSPFGESFTLVERPAVGEERRSTVAVDASQPSPMVLADAASAATRARGANRPFAMLFARPFGPRAAAALAPEDAEAEVYGVSHEDRDRMRRLLDAAAESSRDGRRAVAVGLGVGGLLFGGMGTVMLTLPAAREDRPFQHAFGGGALAIGGLALGGSAIALLTTTKMEDTRDGFVRALDANPREFDRAVREAEREVLARAAAAKRARTIAGYAMSGVGVAALGLGIAGELSAEEPGARLLSRFGIVAGVGYALGGVGVLSLRSEEERLADLWANDPATRQDRPTGGLRLRPLFGLGTVGVAGTF